MECVEDIKTISVGPNQRMWLNAEVCCLLRACDAKFKEGDADALKAARRGRHKEVRFSSIRLGGCGEALNASLTTPGKTHNTPQTLNYQMPSSPPMPALRHQIPPPPPGSHYHQMPPQWGPRPDPEGLCSPALNCHDRHF